MTSRVASSSGSGQGGVEATAEDVLEQGDGLGADLPAAAARVAQQAAGLEVEGLQRGVLATRGAELDHRAHPVGGQQLEEEGGDDQAAAGAGQRAQTAEQQLVEPGVGLLLLADLVGRLQHDLGARQPVQVVADGPEVVDRLGLGDDVQLPALVELEGDVAARLQAGSEAALGLADALGDGPDLAVTAGHEHDDAVRLPQLVGAQHDAVLAVEAHGSWSPP